MSLLTSYIFPVPDVEWQELSCRSNRSHPLICTVRIVSDCKKFHGPNITSVWRIKKLSNCSNVPSYEENFEEKFRYSSALTQNFESLEHFTEYSITVYLKNSIGQSISTRGVFSTIEADSMYEIPFSH